MENLMPVLAQVLQMKPEELAEKAKSTEGLAELENTAKGLKVFKSNDEYLKEVNTYRDSYKKILAGDLFKEHQKTIYDELEGNIKKKFPEVEKLEYKKDYQNTEDLVNKIVSERLKNTNSTPSEWEKEKEQLMNLVKDHKTKLETATTETANTYRSRLINTELNHAIDSISTNFAVDEDKVDSQKAFIKFLIQSDGITITEASDGSLIAKDKNGQTIIDDSAKPKSIKTIVTEIAVKNIPQKDNAQAGGRGNQGRQQQHGTNDWSAYKTWDDYLTYRKESGKPLTVGSEESRKLYEDFKKARG